MTAIDSAYRSGTISGADLDSAVDSILASTSIANVASTIRACSLYNSTNLDSINWNNKCWVDIIPRNDYDEKFERRACNKFLENRRRIAIIRPWSR